jgi:RNA polymerase sigma factor (sigma-70 family)
MGLRRGRDAIQEIQTLYNCGAMGSWTDGQLLTEFLAGHEGNEAALRVLIRRHGPMVLGVCRRILGEEHAAEDAFQNTFVILVKKAEFLRDCNLITNWLFGVALRVARKENAKAARRRVVERRAAGARSVWQCDDPDRDELRAIIDAEINRLPERYRLPLILCHLEGLRHEEVAQKLGCPVGTVESRLSRAREQLRSRLTRRGLAPTASVIGLVASPADGAVSVGAAFSALTESTLLAAVRIVPQRAGVGAIFAHFLARYAIGMSPSVQGGVIVSTVILCACVFPLIIALSQADGQPPRPSANARELAAIPPPPSASPSARKSNPQKHQADPIGEASQPNPPQRGAHAERPRPRRTPSIYAPALADITIDGQLDDWPAAMPRYAIDKLFVAEVAHGDDALSPGTNLSTSSDLSAAFSVGYDLENQVVYLAVIVRDDKVILGHSRPMDTDAIEIYIDGLHSERSLTDPGKEEEWAEAGLSKLPVQQYIAIPGNGRIYGLRRLTNPVLMGGDLTKTKTRMAYNRTGDVTIYEWAIQVFDRYPDIPTWLEPGKRIGFDIAVADKDVVSAPSDAGGKTSSDLASWIYWGPEWRGVKVLDASALGELILAP